MSVVPLHNHSEYSNLDGMATIEEIAKRCVDIGCPCCGLTDHKVVSGHLEFDKVMRKHDIKPIFGCEFYHGTKTEFAKNERDNAHFIALAQTDEGLKNLWRLADYAASPDRFRYVDRISWEALEKYSEGLIATSACIQGLVPQGILKGGDLDPLNRYLEIFKDRFFIELHVYPGEEHERLNWALSDLAAERGIPMVYATDAHYASPEQYEIFDIYVARQTGDSIYTPIEERKMWHPPGMYIQDEDQIRESLSYLPESVVDEAISNTMMIGEMVDAHLPEVKRHLPVFIPAECPWVEEVFEEVPETAAEMLRELTMTGLASRYGNPLPSSVTDLADEELAAFAEGGLEHYMLLAWDTVYFCAREGIEIGPGRGSSAGSVVAYALRITDVDPIHYDLSFERFWNRGRAKGFPDIDSDFPRKTRQRIKDYLAERWGEDNVRSIGNIARMKPKDVVIKTGGACGATKQEIKELTKIIDGVPDLDIHGPESIGWSEDTWPGKTIYVMHPMEGNCSCTSPVCMHNHDTGERIVEWVENKPKDRQKILLRWLEVCDTLCGRISNYGVHASGVVISDEPLPPYAPSRYAAGDIKAPVTNFPMDDIDALMLVKYDVLGLRTLDMLEEWKSLIADEGIKNFSFSGLDLKHHPLEMWQLLDDGFAAGVFQIERGFPKRYAQLMKVRSVEDLSILVAINRPGPIRSGAPASFLARRNGEEPTVYDDTPNSKDTKNGWLLAPILEPTYGWFLYQEQIMKFFEAIGYSKSDADGIRKILGKKKPEDMRDVGLGHGEWEGKGYREVAVQAGLHEDSIEQIWQRIEGFASYSFNKSHSVAYGCIAFRSLFAKYSAPVEFYLSCIRTVDSSKKAKLIPAYVNEARRMGIAIKPPDIYESQARIGATKEGDIYYGLSDVKGVSSSGPFVVKLRKLGYDVSTPEVLSKSLVQFDVDQDIETKRREALADGKTLPKTGKLQLQSHKIDALWNAGAFDEYTDRPASLSQIQEYEQELLGVILSDNTAEAFDRNADDLAECDSYADVENSYWDGDDLRYVVPGIVTGVNELYTKKLPKRKMGVLTIEYDGEEIEFVVRPDLWSSHDFLWKLRTPGIFTIKHYRSKEGQEGLSFEGGHRLT